MQIRIRPMQAEDIPAVHVIDEESFSLPWPERSYHFEINENPATRLWVAELEDENGKVALAGMLVMWVIIDEGHIGTIAVHPSYRRMGIGRQMLASALEEVQRDGVTRVFLEVRRSNLAAQMLYESLGFVMEGVRARYYRDTNEDALLMSLEMQKP